MKTLGIFLCATGLSFCSPHDFKQSYAEYSAALDKARAYSEQSMADPALIVKMAEINDAPEMIAAQYFGEAYVLCNGDTKAVVKDFSCQGWDFSKAPANAEIFCDGAHALLTLHKQGQASMKHH